MTRFSSSNIRSAVLLLLSGMLGLSLACSLSLSAASAAPAIAANAEAISPVSAGQPAPAFTVRTVAGDEFRFDPAALERPALLILFRGGWCPYCNLHLSELRHVVPEISELGIDILFLSGDRPDALYDGLAGETQEDIAGLGYTILSDADAHAAEALGVAFRVAPEYIRKLDEYGADMAGSSVDRRGLLPVPAVFAVDVSGEVAWSRAIPDYRERVAPEKILEVARLIAPE
jgi:peroxiredoxin